MAFSDEKEDSDEDLSKSEFRECSETQVPAPTSAKIVVAALLRHPLPPLPGSLTRSLARRICACFQALLQLPVSLLPFGFLRLPLPSVPSSVCWVRVFGVRIVVGSFWLFFFWIPCLFSSFFHHPHFVLQFLDLSFGWWW